MVGLLKTIILGIRRVIDRFERKLNIDDRSRGSSSLGLGFKSGRSEIEGVDHEFDCLSLRETVTQFLECEGQL